MADMLLRLIQHTSYNTNNRYIGLINVKHSKENWMLITSIAMLAMPITSHAVLLDGGFEQPVSTTDWAFCGGASFDTTSPISGSQSLLLSGDNGSCGGFSVAFQFVAIDNSVFSAGDEIYLQGLVEYLNTGLDPVYIEIAFAKGLEVSDVDFDNGFRTGEISLAGSYQVETSNVLIPDEVLGATATYIRVAAALRTDGNQNSVNTALFDDFKLVSVPEPGIIALFGLGLAGLGFARRKKV
jgi:hypothetical protein